MRTDNGTTNASTVKLNVSEPTPNPVSLDDARFWGATPDGRQVFFTTKENLVASDTSNTNLSDLYRYDADAQAGHHLTLISSPDAGRAADVQNVIGMSDDGSYVYFVSTQQLLNDKPSDAGVYRIFVWHDGAINDVAAVDELDARSAAGVNGFRLGTKTARVSPDGGHLVFVSKSSGGTASDDLPHTGVGDACTDAGGCEEVYVYDAVANSGSGKLTCASCYVNANSPSQTNATFLPLVGRGFAWLTSHLNHPLSADGRFVFFDTGDPLVTADRDGLNSDVYEYDTVAGEVHLLSSGSASSQGSYFLDASVSGGDAFFVTGDRLVGWDTDVQRDLYDARIDGGVPEPVSPVIECMGDECRNLSHGTQTFGAPSSSTFAGLGDLPAPVTKGVGVKKRQVSRNLARALKACKKRSSYQRKKCEARARRYSTKKTSKSGGSK
jgi:hypothetical protein